MALFVFKRLAGYLFPLALLAIAAYGTHSHLDPSPRAHVPVRLNPYSAGDPHLPDQAQRYPESEQIE